MSEEVDWLMFPIRNEQGFRVTDADTYRHMIQTIIRAQLELAEDYPNQKILAVYECGAEDV